MIRLTSALVVGLGLVGSSLLSGCSRCVDCEQESITVASVRVEVGGPGGPLAGVTTQATAPPLAPVSGVTAANGTAVLDLIGLAPGATATVTLSAVPGYSAAAPQQATLVTGDTVAVTFTMTPNP